MMSSPGGASTWTGAALAVLSVLIGSVVGSESERHPLAGGIGTGMKVRVVVEGIDVADDSKVVLDFETREHDIAFRLNPKNSDQKIDRISRFDGVWQNSQVLGGWPFADLATRITFDFLKTKYAWQVSIDSKRTPWFDFPMTQSLITHLRIWKGFKDPEVILSQPLCEVHCDVSECENEEGASTCLKEGEYVDADQCFSTFPTGPRHANCSVEETTDQNGGNCCDGMRTEVELSSVGRGDWVLVSKDADLVSRSCKAFQLEAAGCSTLQGRPVRVESVDQAALTLQCWAPPSTSQSFPYYAVTPHTPQLRNVSLTSSQLYILKDLDRIDFYTRRVKETSQGLLQNWYVLAMHEKDGSSFYTEPWVPLLGDRWDYWADNSAVTVNVLVTDVGARLINYVTDCVDLTVSGTTTWKDRNGGSCADHRANNWCTEQGQETEEFKARSFRRKTFEKMAADDMYAPKACCGCGGGSLGGTLGTLPAPLVALGLSVQQVQAEAWTT